jgi:hypothetical protein
MWFLRADGYRKADPECPTLREEGIVEWEEARRWRRNSMIELTAQATYEAIEDLNAFYDARYVNFRGVAWRLGGVQLVQQDRFAVDREMLEKRVVVISLEATADPRSKGPPQPTAEPRLDHRAFLQILNRFEFAGSPPVMLESGIMGMANHLHGDVVLVDAYDGSDHKGVYRIPYANLLHMGGGAFFAGLEGVPEPTGAEGRGG